MRVTHDLPYRPRKGPFRPRRLARIALILPNTHGYKKFLKWVLGSTLDRYPAEMRMWPSLACGIFLPDLERPSGETGEAKVERRTQPVGITAVEHAQSGHL